MPDEHSDKVGGFQRTFDPRLPNLFVVGAPKSGTTSLDAVLRQHPQIYMSARKETRFFSRDAEYARGIAWYLDTYFADAHGYVVRGEATPTYLYWHQKTIPRLRAALPAGDIRFIAILRNPIERAYSHYWMNRLTKVRTRETLTFEAALQAEEARSREHPEWVEAGFLSSLYFRTGLYAEQVEAFQQAFGSEQVLVLLFEDLLPEHFPAMLRDVETFLGVGAVPLEGIRKKASKRLRSRSLTVLLKESRPLRRALARFVPRQLRGRLKAVIEAFNNVPFQYPEMSRSTRSHLADMYGPSIARLGKLIDRDLSIWSDWNANRPGNGSPERKLREEPAR